MLQVNALSGFGGQEFKRRNTISYVNSASSYPSESVTIPTHQVGDLIVIIAYNSDASGAPIIPADFIPVLQSTTGPWHRSIGYRIATTTTTTSGTWTNATSLTVAIYRGASAVGASINRTSSATTTITWDNLTLTENAQNTSWVVGMAAVFNNSSGTPNAPSGRTERLNANYNRLWDTNGPITGNYTSQTASMSSQSYVSAVIEIVSQY